MRHLDLAVILAYLAGITWFGARFRHRQKTLKDYFLGGRSAPWWAIGLSVILFAIIGGYAEIAWIIAAVVGLHWLLVLLVYLRGRTVPIHRELF